MKRILLTSSILVPLGFAIANGCAVDDSTPQTGNTTSGAAGDTSGGTAGDTSGGTAGDTGSSGSVSPAGGTSGGSMAGTGGDTGTGGGGSTGAGGAGGAGVGGAGGAGGSANPMDVVSLKSDFGYSMADSWFITGCAQKAGHDCITIQNCPNQASTTVEETKGSVSTETFPIGGVMGTTYLVSFKFNGISEGKFYAGGAWAVAATDLATAGGPKPNVNENGIADDTFYIGGKSVDSNYNVMRIRVMDSTKKEVGRYYMNAYDSSSGAESHRTFLLSYAHTIEVPGKGFVEYHIEDSNCHAIDNCGPGNVSDTVCDAARNIPNEPNVVLPAMYTDVASTTQPHLVTLASLNPVTHAAQPWHAQISHLTVTKVAPKP